MTQLSATLVAATAIFLPIQTGVSGSILALIIPSASGDAAIPLASPAQVNTINQISKEADKSIAIKEVPANVAPITLSPVSEGSNSVGAPRIISETNRPAAINARDNLPTNRSDTTVPLVLAKISTKSASADQSISDDRKEATSPAKTLPKVRLQIRSIFLTEKDSDDLGLDWLFGSRPTENVPVETSHDWKDLLRGIHIAHGSDTNNHPRSVVVDILSSGKSVILNHEQFAALIARVEEETRDDVLAAPKVETLSGRDAHVSVVDVKEIVTGVEAKPGNIGYFTDYVDTGFTFDVVPTAKDDNSWRLNVVVRYLTFQGYDKLPMGTVSVPGGIPSKYQQPLPHFRLLEASADASPLLGETMAIRGPLITETVKTKGRLFVRAKTKTVHQRLYVFVTPSRYPEVNP